MVTRNQMDQYNVVWTTQSKNSGESMPCGGGDIGLNVWVENGEILFYVSRSGSFDESNAYLKLGRVRLALEPTPFGPGQTFRQELRLWQGDVEIVGAIAGKPVVVHAWVDVHNPLIHVEIQSETPVSLRASYENWRLDERRYNQGEVGMHRGYDGAPEQPISYPDTVEFSGAEVLAFHRNRDGDSAFDMTVHHQGLDHVKDKLWNPLKNLTFGMSMSGETLTPADTEEGIYLSTPFRRWTLSSDNPSTRHDVTICAHVDNAETLATWKDGLAAIGHGHAASRCARREATQAWWAVFWDRSHIDVLPGDARPKDQAWRVGRNYQLFRYMLGTNAYGRYPTKFNGGNFTVDPELTRPDVPYSADYRLWSGGTFTAQNQRLVYWPMLKSGDFDMMESQFDFYRNIFPNALVRNIAYWDHAGAAFPEQIENFGLPQMQEYGWSRLPGMHPGVEDNAWVSHQTETVLEFCLMMLDVQSFSGKDITGDIAFIEACLVYFDEHYQQLLQQSQGRSVDENGHLVLYPGTACEAYKNTYNSVTTIAGLKIVIERLLALPAHYLDAEKRAYFQGFLSRIPDIPLRLRNGKTTIAPAARFSHIQGSEVPQMYPVFPFARFGIGMPDLQIALDTWEYGLDSDEQRGHQSWRQDPIFCARLGLTDQAAAATARKLDDSERRFPTFWGPGYDWVPDHNWGGSGMIGLQEMLLQTVGEKIHLLPAWPPEWDVDFKLHVPGDTTVSGTLKAGVLTRLDVQPPSRSSDIEAPSWCQLPLGVRS